VNVLKTLPTMSLLVLISTKKVADYAMVFNFESVWNKYEIFSAKNNNLGISLSKQSFLKIFLDLVEKGFLKSENSVDVLNTNNKISIGMRLEALDRMLMQNVGELGLSGKVVNWLQQ
jgi:hypothetical protein